MTQMTLLAKIKDEQCSYNHLDFLWVSCRWCFDGLSFGFLPRDSEAKKRKREKEHAGLLRAHYAIMSQWNIVEGIRKNLLEPHRDAPQRFLKLPVFYSFGEAVRVPFEDISFIAHSGEPNMLQEIHIAEQNFDTVINIHKLLTQKLESFYSDPSVKTIEFNINTGKSCVEADPKKIFFIKKLTDILYDAVDKALPILRKESDNLTAFTKERFKGMKALKLAMKESGEGHIKKEDFADNYSVRKWVLEIWKDLKKLKS